MKNDWEIEGLRKMKDNGHREKENSWKQKQRMIRSDCEMKCNIQKGLLNGFCFNRNLLLLFKIVGCGGGNNASSPPPHTQH